MKTYYDFQNNSTDPMYPPAGDVFVDSILEALRYHYSVNVLYKAETYAVSKERWMITDMTTSMQMRESEKKFNWSNARYPFTAYTVGNLEDDTLRPNFFARSHRYYSAEFNRIIYANPCALEIPMYTFYNTAADYHRAITLLRDDKAIKILKEVPITVNGLLTSFPIVVIPDITKGNLAYEFEQQLKVGKIFDVNHTVKVFYHEIIVSSSTTPRENAFIIGPVDSIEVALKDLTQYEIGKTRIYASGLSPDTPSIVTTDPTNNEENVDVDHNIILNFNVSMNTDSVEDGLMIVPGVNANYIWNSLQTQLVIDKIDPFASGTSYTVSLARDHIVSSDTIPFEEDYEFSFVTE